MNLLLRTFWTLIRGFFRERMSVTDTSVIRLRVWPNDIDVNLHLNNGRYFSMMDLGRFDLVVRAGLLGTILKRRWQPTVASEMIRFRRSLRPFQEFELRTRILGWDEKYFYLEQLFVAPSQQGEVICAVGIVKGLFRGPLGNIPPSETIAASGQKAGSPRIPQPILDWAHADQEYLSKF